MFMMFIAKARHGRNLPRMMLKEYDSDYSAGLLALGLERCMVWVIRL
jgi:hypothetical protein